MIESENVHLLASGDRERLLTAFEEIGQLVQASLDLDEVLDILARSVMGAGIFRSLMVALVDRPNHTLRVVRQASRFKPSRELLPIEQAKINRTPSVYHLDDDNVAVEVVHTGELTVIDGWDERFRCNDAPWVRPETHRDKVSYFFPVIYDGQVIAVLATASNFDNRESMLNRIEAMIPLLGQIGIALRHAQMHQEVALKAELLDHEVREHILRQDVLIKINQAVQTMRDPADIEVVLHTVYDGLRTLDINCQILALHRPYNVTLKQFETFAIVPRSKGVQIIRSVNETPIVHQIFEGQKTAYYPDAIQDAGYRSDVHLQRTYEKWGLRVRSIVDTVNDRSVFVFMSNKKRAFSASQVQFLKEISQTIVVGLARLEDLETAMRRAESRALLLDVGRATQNMTKAEDFRPLLQTLSNRLRAHGLNFVGVSLYRVLNEETQEIDSYHHRPDGSLTHTSGINLGVVGDWQKGETIHRPNTEEDPKGLPDDYLDHMYREFNLRVKSMLNVPYARGVLVLRSDMNDAFSEDDIRFVEQIADMLSIAIARVEDLEQLEMQNEVLKEREKKIQMQLQELESVYQHTPVGLFMLDRDLCLLRFNHWIAKINGLSKDAIGRSLVDIIPDQIAERRKVFDRVFESGQPVRDLEVQGYTPTEPDVLRTWLAHYYPLRSENGEVDRILGAVVDITEKKHMEEERLHSNRLRALGEMAAGVSHNLNNILTGILGPAQFLQASLTDDETLKDLETIITSGLRARDIVRELNRGLRNDREALERVCVGDVIHEAVLVSQTRWKHETKARGISVDLIVEPIDVLYIQGTKTGLHDILINLIFNAVDAMPQGGTVTIGAYKRGHGIRIVVRDTGQGMSGETQKRIFDPFFTTKVDVGTGLGLSTVYGTVTRWGGHVGVESALGQGAVFYLDFGMWEDVHDG